jgi:hypothetical protein
LRKIQLRHHLARQIAQPVGLGRGQPAGARFAVDDAQATEHMTALASERSAGIEADVRIARDKGVRRGTRVGGQIRDDQQVRRDQRISAYGAVEIGLAGFEARARLEPLSIPGHQTDKRDRRAADLHRQVYNVVKARFRHRVEDRMSFEGGQSGGVKNVIRNGTQYRSNTWRERISSYIAQTARSRTVGTGFSLTPERAKGWVP